MNAVVIQVFLIVFMMLGGIGWCTYDNTKPEVIARKAEEEKKLKEWCTTPRLISTTQDGVRLWAVMGFATDGRYCGRSAVYFSSSGTSWQTTHGAGKTSHTEHHQVPNEEANDH